MSKLFKYETVLNSVEIEDDIDVEVVAGISDSSNYPTSVILFNEQYHSFDEVIFQLIKATNCSTQRANGLANQVHTRGKARVFEGTMTDCIRVSTILEEIELSTRIEV